MKGGIGMADISYTQEIPSPGGERGIRELMDSFARATGMELSVWDEAEHPCGYGGRNDTRFCSLLHGCGLGFQLCVGADKEAFRRARERDGIYCYRCPFGLTEAVLPIRQGERLYGFLMAGKVTDDLPERAGEIRQRVLTRYPDAGRYFDLDGAIADIPQRSAEAMADSLRLLSALAEILAERGIPAAGAQSMAKNIRRFLDGNFDRRVTLPELAVRFHCSTVTLNTHFRRSYGVTVLHYLNRRRMEHAEKLLRESDMTLEEIADRCGFADADYFSRVFRRRHGTGPLAYRRGTD